MRVRVLARLALMPAAALLVHQLRFMLAFGSGAGLVLARQGHSYLHSLVPWAVLALALATGGFLSALGRALGGRRSLPRYALSFAALWLLCSACLVGIYVAQELLEGAVIAGHPALLAGVFGHGGWWAIPAALCVGLVLAAVFQGTRWMLEVAVRYGTRRRLRTTHSAGQRRPSDVLIPRLAPLVAGWSGRGPPG
jgi:hypothetical protein